MLRHHIGRSVRTCVLVSALVALGDAGWAAGSAAAPVADSPRLQPPRSRLGRPFDAPILAVGYVGLGGGLAAGQDAVAPAYGGAVVFRPGSAANFLDFLYAWNCGLVLQADYQNLSDTDSVLSADGIVRRYLRDRGRDGTEVRLFLGLGLGATRFTEPGTAGRQQDKYWSGVIEVGQEWLTGGRWCLVLRGQYRMHLRQQHNHGAWQVVGGVGLPFPL
ncbi:MAG: hypothetical protein ABR506_11325 [Candidatus Krumholzibacteriia bacterium]